VENGPAGELYRVLFDHVDKMVCTLDLEGRFTSINAAGERLTGYAASELAGRFAVELIAPEHRDEAVRRFRRRLGTTGELPSDDSVLLSRDGTYIPIEITSVLLGHDGEVDGVLGLVRDLSERRGAERALHESEERFRMLLEAAPDGVVIADTDGRVQLVNAQTERLFGYERDELHGQPVELLLPESVRAAHAAHRAGYHRDARTREMGAGLPLSGLRKDGTRFPVDVSLSPLQTEEGLLVLASVRDVSERRRAEETLLESEQRFRQAFQFASIGMALVAPDGRFLQVNDALCDIVGYPAEELIAKTFQDITHPDDLEADLGFVEQMLAGEIRTYQMEKRYVSSRGDVVWVLLSVSLVRSRDGTPVHFVSQIQDITERKRAEEALARSQARLAQAQRMAQIGDWEWNVEANVLTWSEETYRIFGIDPEDPVELTYQRFLAVIHPDDRPAFEHVAARARADGRAYTHQYRVVLPDGSTRWVEGRGELVVRDGAPMAMRGTAQDITEDKAAEERLAEAEERYRSLVEQLPLGTYIRPLDMRQPNIYASPQVGPMLGYPAEDWMTNPNLLATIVHPDDRDRVLSDASHVRGTGEALHAEYRYVKPDGSVVWVQDETYVVCDETGEPQCVQGYLLDITKRKLAEEERDRLREELHHAQKLEAVGRLAGGVAHDFNNMLTAIKGYSELLLNGLEPSSPLRAEAEQIHRAAAQASTLPRQLLAFSRKQMLEPRLVDLNEVVSEATDLIKLLLGGDVELVVSPLARPTAVVADPTQVEQVLINLATNARDAMPGGGNLTISTRNSQVDAREAREHKVAPGRYVVVSVSDTGEGMDAETLAQVFEPFFTTKGAGQGSGLGLASAYGITRQSGGFIRVTSEPGSGATFDACFPLAVAGYVPAEPEPGLGESEESASATVLLVEDEEVVREFAATALERAGFRVLTAARGTDALELCERDDVVVDVLVSDVVMPGIGGRELAERLLELSQSTGVVFVSGYTDEPADRRLDGGQVPAFLQKPFSVSALVAAVRDACAGPATNGTGQTVPMTHSLGISCLVADDHPAVLDAVSRFLETSGIEVVARVGRGDEALAAIEAHRPDLALLDVTMEPISGIDVSRRAGQLVPDTQVILYTGYRDTKLLEQALDAGARGFVLKEAPLSELIRAMKTVAGGGTFVDAELSSALATPGTMQSLSPLTPRERQVLVLVADGMTNDRAAVELGISAETVQSHVRNAMSKLEADTRTQAVATALRQSLIA
jgi:two-component system, cell cycle sensor histidine kinase and response regulator CckA